MATVDTTAFFNFAHEAAGKDNFVPSTLQDSQRYFTRNWRDILMKYSLKIRQVIVCNNEHAEIKNIAQKYYRKHHPTLFMQLVDRYKKWRSK